jgi:hypothetical protein
MMGCAGRGSGAWLSGAAAGVASAHLAEDEDESDWDGDAGEHDGADDEPGPERRKVAGAE